MHLIAPAALLSGSDLPQARHLISVVEANGGSVLLLQDRLLADPIAFWDQADFPDSVEELIGYLNARKWLPDETVFVASTEKYARLAASARLKVAILEGPAAQRGFPADEIWPDLATAADWFERHGQLAKRSWPIATVGGLVFAPDETALFVRTAKWSGTWGVPGGKIDYGETSEAAFLREIHEETGLLATAPELTLVQDAIEEPEFFRPRHFLLLNFRARCESKVIHLNHESLEAGWYSLSQALSLPLNRPTRALVEALQARSR